MERTIKIALVGAGMFGGDVHARAYADLQRFGIAGQLARVGLDKYSRELAPVKFDLVAVATRSEKSAHKAAAAFKAGTGLLSGRGVDLEHAGNLSALHALGDQNLHLRAGGHRFITGGLQGADVQEGVARAIGEFDEAEALVALEPFHGGVNRARGRASGYGGRRSEEHTSELQSH